ncbi:hypothetical protein F5Y00DRAFT_231708 [Daldinia vernicosa]|uniref:uncharacterized protein n=1 Tax=Daldinia vernicosa TaxID=114800 RepID=UPI002008DEE2|nr:uncharacterized protein F5Y00DRAFT_231708 [Daldinia vernicosa]KAI0851077.1 hypothetical protein F5Y00DRAFT_231708 [Daldinia vernicosa]
MAYRVSQPDPDPAQTAFASAVDFSDYGIFNRPVSFGRPSTPANATPFNPNQQDYSSYQFPSLPSLLNERQFSGGFNSPQRVDSYVPCYSPHDHNPSATNHYNHGQGRSSRTSTRPEFAFPALDSSIRRLPRSAVNSHTDTHTGVAPPRAQGQRPSSSNINNIHAQLPPPNIPAAEANGDDYYLSALADGDFSSPSLPPINSSPLPPTRLHISHLPKPLEVGEAMPTAGPRCPRSNKGHLVDLTKEEPDFDSFSGIDPTTPAMPPRKRAAAGANSDSASKRRRTSQSSLQNSGRASRLKWKPNDQDPFVDDGCGGPANDDGHETIDLSNAAEVPSEFMAPKADNRIKIGKFQCVICMDDTSYLTVTHCGHLFCSECLHSALHIDNMRKTCPVCRTKVDPKDKKGKNQKSYYHLELKIMTANKKGKRPAVSS